MRRREREVTCGKKLQTGETPRSMRVSELSETGSNRPHGTTKPLEYQALDPIAAAPAGIGRPGANSIPASCIEFAINSVVRAV